MTRKKHLNETRHWGLKKKNTDNQGKKFPGELQGKKAGFAFPRRLPGKPGKRYFSWGNQEMFPAVGSIVLVPTVEV